MARLEVIAPFTARMLLQFLRGFPNLLWGTMV
jgi:ABC-type phosphate/phosphonate transport system permease subunit